MGNGMTQKQELLAVCTDGMMTGTQYADVTFQGQEEDQCFQHVQQMDCSKNMLFGDGSDATCKGKATCPSGSGQCDVWEMPSAALSVALGKTLHESRSPNLLGDSDSPITMYYKTGTNKVDSMTQTQESDGKTIQMQYTFDTFDDSTPVDSNLWVVPDSWQPCTQQSEKLVAV